MKKLFSLLGLVAVALSAQAQTIDPFYELTLDGKPWFRFGAQADCDAAVKTYGNAPEVKALGANAVFDCPRRIRFVPAATVPPVTPPVVVPPVVTPPATVGRGMSAACEAVVATDFALNTSRAIDPLPTLAKPARGVAFLEPTYKTCIVRATDHVADGINGFTRNDYARRQAFNADSSRYIAYALNGSWHLYDANTTAHLTALIGPGGDAEVQWSATDPDLLYYTPTNGVGLKLYELNVKTGVSRVAGDFAARLKAKWPTANAAWTKSEGSPSKDGRYWCFMVDDVAWGGLGMFTWDRETDTILGMSNHPGGVRPDHVSMSPSGNYCVWAGSTVEAFSRDMTTHSTVVAMGEHSDIAIDANGDDVFVSVDYQSNAGDIYMVNLRTKQRTALLSTYINGGATALHVSGKGFNKPGWMLLSTYADYGPSGRQWMYQKVMAVQLQANPKVVNLAFTRQISNGYWTEPHGSTNRDFTKMLFNSNWNVNTDTDVDAYMLELPAGAIK